MILRQPVFALTPYDSETTSICSNPLWFWDNQSLLYLLMILRQPVFALTPYDSETTSLL